MGQSSGLRKATPPSAPTTSAIAQKITVARLRDKQAYPYFEVLVSVGLALFRLAVWSERTRTYILTYSNTYTGVYWIVLSLGILIP
jgi:hypothetical protein